VIIMNVKYLALNLMTAAVGDTGKEAGFGAVAAVAATIASAYLGGWDTALQLLIFLMVLDYATGLAGAIRSRTVNSETMFWGGIRKGVVMAVVALAVMLDRFVGGDAPVFRSLAMYFYIAREGLSVVENLDLMGVPLPNAIKQFLQQLQRKGDTTNDTNA